MYIYIHIEIYVYILFNLNVPDAEIAINSKDSFTLPAAAFSEREEIVEAKFVLLLSYYCHWTETIPSNASLVYNRPFAFSAFPTFYCIFHSDF